MHYLLIGAGFTRNWGGPLSEEVTGSLLGDLHDDPELSAILRKEPLESAFPGFQKPAKVSERRLQEAVTELFNRLNRSLLEIKDFDFSTDRRYSVLDFLAKFDAIFSLNQDLLLECHYLPRFVKGGKWDGVVIPGMTPERLPGQEHYGALAEYWRPTGNFDLPATSQPLVKLHGSTNWSAAPGERILIMGNQKSGPIQSFNVLRRCHEFFSSSLTKPNSKLMVIGYSFQDEHINAEIVSASSRNGLGTYIVDPNGRKVLKDPKMARAQIAGPPRPIEGIKLIGELRRPLSAVFSTDRFAHEELMRFFR